MSKKDDIRHLWRESFSFSNEYLDLLMNRIYREDYALTATLPGDTRVMSALLMKPYGFLFHGSEMKIYDIAGAVTRRQARGKGLMNGLLRDALLRAKENGAVACTLVPRNAWLYFYFARLGFATVFFSDIQRFTSLHRFAIEPAHDIYHSAHDSYAKGVYDALRRIELSREGSVVHTERDFHDAIDASAIRAGEQFVAVANEMGEVRAMAFAHKTDSALIVDELIGFDETDKTAALRQLRQDNGEIPFVVYAQASDNHTGKRNLHSRGMLRIVDVGSMLEALAQQNPRWRCTIRVRDSILDNNNHVYTVRNSKVEIDDTITNPRMLDFDVTIDTLAKIMFSSPKIGNDLNWPSNRAHLGMMLPF